MSFDVAIAGSGPAALAAAVAVAVRGPKVLVLAGPDAPWVPNYGGWVDELAEVGLGDVLEPVWSDAVVTFDDDRTAALGRAYARVDRDRLRASLLARCEALGVAVRFVRAVEVAHDATGSTLRSEDGAEHRAALVVDATGHRPVFVRRTGEPTLFQAAVGWLGRPRGAVPWDASRMTFMDLRTDHVDDDPSIPTFLYAQPFPDGRVFVEETSLVRGPALSFDVLGRRLRTRLARLGVVLDDVEETETCLIPMDTPLPDLGQRVVGFGGAASLVHPASGYLLARCFGTAPDLAEAVATGLGAGRPPARVAAAAWRAVWRREDLLRRELHLFGTRIVAALDAVDQRAFFEAFFAMPRTTWARYLAGRARVGELMKTMGAMLVHGNPRIRRTLIRAGGGLPGVFVRAVR